MGHKVHPHGFRLGHHLRLGIKWYADKDYTERLHEDLELRRFILKELPDAAICHVEIERNANQVTSPSTRPSRASSSAAAAPKVDELRNELERSAAGACA